MKLNKNTNFAKLSSAKFLILYCYIGIYIIVQILAKADNQVTIVPAWLRAHNVSAWEL